MNVCHEFFERKQIFDSYGSRPGQGILRLLHMVSEAGRLKAQLRKTFKDPRLLKIFDDIVDSHEDSPGRGLPIGNLSSQYFANHCLVGLDVFVKERLGCKAYVRYMDDMVLWHDDKAWLKEAHRRTGEFLRTELQCDLKPELLNRTALGLPFLGCRIFPFHVRLLQRSKVRFARKMRAIEENCLSGAWSEAVCRRHALPLIAFTELADAVKFRRNVMDAMHADNAQCVA